MLFSQKSTVLVGSLVFATILAMIGVPKPMAGQISFGTILGTVSDPSHAAIPNVAITVTNAETGAVRTGRTDQYGNYRVGSLLPGVYSLKAEASGFQVSTITDIQVPVAVAVTQNVVMKVGTTRQTVEVKSTAPLIDTANSTVGTVINNKSVVNMPLNGRHFTDLLSLIPGSVAAAAPFSVGGGTNYSVSGMRYEQNNFTLDGVNDNESFFKNFAIQPSIDAIQEFKVQSNISSAAYGSGSAANVNVVMKSGTNHLHGSVFEFVRNDKFDANDFFRNRSSLGKPAFRQNDYGFVVGGPVYIPHVYNGRDRTFWLFNFEGTKVRRPSTVLGTIPTQTEFNGDLRDQPPIYDPSTTTQVGVDANGNPIYHRDQISCNGVLNVICPDRIDPAIKAYTQAFYPMVNQGGSGNIVNTNPYMLDTAQENIRVDQRITNKLWFFSRYSTSNMTQTSPTALPAENSLQANRFRNAVASWTYATNPTTVLNFKLGFNRTNIFTTDTIPAPGAAAFLAAHPLQGIGVPSASAPLYPRMNIIGYSGPSQSAFPWVTNNFQYLGSVSKMAGRHSIEAGFNILHNQGMTNLGYQSGWFQFDQSATADPLNPNTTGSAIASYLLGLPYFGNRHGASNGYARSTNYAVYLQDDIKVTRKLTLNLGLRYEYDQWPYEKYNHFSTFDTSTRQFIWTGTNPVTGQGPNTRRSIADPDFNNFAPRVGLAYQINNKTTVRSGYGVFYASNFIWQVSALNGQYPYGISEAFSGTNAQFPDMPIETFFSPYLQPNPDTVPTGVYAYQRDNRTPYSQQWNFGIQRELAQNLMLEVDYIGNKGTKMAIFVDGNDALPGPGTVGSPEHPRPYPENNTAFVNIMDAATSNYNALQVKLDKRFSNGLQLLGSYAWGHYIDLGGACYTCPLDAPQDPRNWKAGRASGAYDRRQVFTVSYVYQLPFGRGKHWLSGATGVMNQVVGGWEVSGITHYNTGAPVNVVEVPYDNANVGPLTIPLQRPNLVLGQPLRIRSSADKTLGWLNPAAFSLPAPYTFGNLGRNAMRGPGFGDWDLGLFKDFPFNEGKQRFQFRAEAFNLFNHVNLANPNSTFGATGFGQIFGVQNPSREIQLALKLLF